MKKLSMVLLLLGVVLIPVQGYSQMGMMRGQGMMGVSMVRHHYVMRNGIDPKYSPKVNTLKQSSDNIAEGKELYERNCKICHGLKGLGDGPSSKSFDPPAANIAVTSKMPIASDPYLYWTIAEGGVMLETAMPPYKELLKEDEIWKIILYLREL